MSWFIQLFLIDRHLLLFCMSNKYSCKYCTSAFISMGLILRSAIALNFNRCCQITFQNNHNKSDFHIQASKYSQSFNFCIPYSYKVTAPCYFTFPWLLQKLNIFNVHWSFKSAVLYIVLISLPTFLSVVCLTPVNLFEHFA